MSVFRVTGSLWLAHRDGHPDDGPALGPWGSARSGEIGGGGGCVIWGWDGGTGSDACRQLGLRGRVCAGEGQDVSDTGA